MDQSNNNPCPWVEEIDYLRGFAILAVIMIHTSAAFVAVGKLNSLVIANVCIDVFSQFAVPLFVLTSGVVLSLRYGIVDSLWAFYGRRAKSIVPQYLIFSFGYVLFSAIRGASLTLGKVIFGLLTASSHYHLWFFAIIIQFYILYPAIIRGYHYFNCRKNMRTFFLLSLFAQLSWSVLRIILNYLPFRGSSGSENLLGIAWDRLSLSYLFYFVMGVHIGQNLESFKTRLQTTKFYRILAVSILLTTVISLFWIIGLVNYSYFYDIPPYYFLVPTILEPALYSSIFVLCYKVSRCLLEAGSVIACAIYRFGKLSLGIYLIHELFRSTIVLLLRRININSEDWIFYPLVFIATAILSYASVYAISHLPYSELVVGLSLPDAFRQSHALAHQDRAA